jgi:hypothetical protein
MTLVGLPQREKGSACAEPFMSLVGRTGFEPVTNGLKVRIRVSRCIRILLKIKDLAQLARSRPQSKAGVRSPVCLPICLPKTASMPSVAALPATGSIFRQAVSS